MSDDRIKRKILLLGDGAVGKTSLIRRYVVDKFSDDYITTIGTKVTKKDLRIESPGRTADITFMIWDVLGQRGYKNIQGGSFQGAKGALLVYDVTRPETLRSVQEYWIPHLIEITKPIPIVLVGNKIDLCKDRATARDGLEDAMEALRINGFLSSAKTGESVEASFACLAKAILLDVESKVRRSEQVEEDVPNELIAVCDQIIMDSCDVMGGQEAAMPIVRQQIVRAGLDVNAPSAEGLKLTVEYLAEAESGFRNAEDVEASKLKRLGWIKAVS
jgi:small GTP-binding protein